MLESLLPHVTAGFDALSLVFLLIGFVLIRTGHRDAHRKAMLGAVISGGLFLVFYVVHHAYAPLFAFRGPDSMRPWYFTFLFSHVVLAAAILPFIIMVLRRALAGRFVDHRWLARRVLPLWIYTTATGVLVYVLLYHIYPPVS